MMLAGMLIEDHAEAPQAFTASEGDQLDIVGALDGFVVPTHWTDVHPALTGSTYRLEQDNPDVLFLITGMDAGWEDTTVTAHVVVVLDTQHPDRDARIVVLSVSDVPRVSR